MSRRAQRVRLVLYLVIETAFLILFTVLDFQNRISTANLHKFLSIAFNTLSLILFEVLLRSEKSTSASSIRSESAAWPHPSLRSFLPAPALLLTLAADVFLILLDCCYLLGVLLFCLVQSLYALYLLPERGALSSGAAIPARAVLLLRALLYGLILLDLRVAGLLDALTAASLFSMTQLTLNVLFGWRRFARQKTTAAGLLALGLTLFWGCDVCVGLRNMTAYLPGFPAWIPGVAGAVIWFFYLPSQVLIFLSYTNERTLSYSIACLPKRRLP